MSQPETQAVKPSAWLRKTAGPGRRWTLLAIVAGLLLGLALVLQADRLAYVVSGLVEGRGGLADYSAEISLLVLAVCLRALFGFLREWAGVRASLSVRQALRQELLVKLDRLGPGFTHRRQSGELSTLLLEQVEALDGFIARYLPQMAQAVGLPLIILLFVLPQNWAVALIFILTAPLVPLFMALVGMKAADANRRNFQVLANLSSYLLDVIQGLPTLKLFQRSESEAATIARVSEEFRLKTMEVLRLAFLSSAVLEFFASVSIALTAVYLGFSFLGQLGFGAWEGDITLYQALFILLLAPEFYLPLRELGTQYHAKQEAVAASEKLMELLDEAEHQAESGSLAAPDAPINIRFEQVSLTYPGAEQAVLSGLDLSIEPGQPVAIAGPSGVGKSSLMNLLLGFYPLSQGRILINGQELVQLDRDSWLSRVAWVSQHTTLFSGTLRENLLLADPDADDVRLRRVCDAAHVTEFLDRLPQGLDTRVEEAGAGLSGGQIQRIALARALLKDAPVLLLDEPTANLDRESELLILQALEAFARDRTVLILSHRDATLLAAKHRFRLRHGRLEVLSGEAGGEL
ncbi:thiol reductant ABC exporter subunit CydD [Marinobacterium lutimaris]|uniref:ATP-binding cassette, subfamily C, CydD n=1 Tax=Marinobacterium lutimaris TaxID=568106 RepID=A0A1H5WLT6_9GAMM|nr:thiol reductant ABC exporter subunit CydD [Marinobacterium lutimaris]SEG00293.1 ATP-binding cassette, subfamily C, CydD [Marinobacterium lutimaris]